MKRYYNKSSLERAKDLRKNQTETEQIIWSKLRNRNLNNIKFTRQVPIDGYIVDFLCQEKKLIVEIDGSQHIEKENYDKARTDHLNRLGYTVIRIYNNDVFNNIDNVLQYILDEYNKL